MMKSKSLKPLILAGIAVTSSACSEREAESPHPNIVFILADDLGWGDLGCYGQTMFQTPGIDSLAANGIRFTQCYSGTTVSAPSRGDRGNPQRFDRLSPLIQYLLLSIKVTKNQ